MLTETSQKNLLKPVVILLSGKPKAGKDTLANAMMGCLYYAPVFHLKFSRRLKEVCLMLCGVDLAEVADVDEYVDAIKDDEDWMGQFRPGTVFRTFRDLLIAMSEKFVKPNMGEMFWADTVIKQIESTIRSRNAQGYKSQPVFIVSDCGFEPEVLRCLYELVDIATVLLVVVERPGTEGIRDSRHDLSHMIGTVITGRKIINDCNSAEQWELFGETLLEDSIKMALQLQNVDV